MTRFGKTRTQYDILEDILAELKKMNEKLENR